MLHSGVLRDINEIEDHFHRLIPITQAMGVRVESYDGQQLVLQAPITLNHNHLGTAFGGSLNTLATLAGYGFLWLEVGDPQYHVVIRESSIVFHRPVQRDLRAICRRPTAEALAEFHDQLTRKGRGRIRLTSTLEEDGLVAVQFEGTFVVVRGE